MTSINGSRLPQRFALGLLALMAAGKAGQAFQIAAELPSAAAAGTLSSGTLLGVAQDARGQSLQAVQVTGAGLGGKN